MKKSSKVVIDNMEKPVNTVYIRRLETVQAIRWYPGVKIDNVTMHGDDKGILNIYQGAVIINPGEWVVKDATARQRVYTDIEFRSFYEEVIDASMDGKKSPV